MTRNWLNCSRAATGSCVIMRNGCSPSERTRKLTTKLEALVNDEALPRHSRMAALWVLIGSEQFSDVFSLTLMSGKDAGFAAWGVRAAENRHTDRLEFHKKILELSQSSNPDVLLQAAIAANKLALRKLEGADPVQVLFNVLVASGKDDHLHHVVWQNLYRYWKLAAKIF